MLHVHPVFFFTSNLSHDCMKICLKFYFLCLLYPLLAVCSCKKKNFFSEKPLNRCIDWRVCKYFLSHSKKHMSTNNFISFKKRWQILSFLSSKCFGFYRNRENGLINESESLFSALSSSSASRITETKEIW